MERFRQLGEVLGSIKALMVFRESLQINQRQCCLLLDMLTYAYETVAELLRHNLKFEEKQSKWKVVEQPLRELQRVFKEGESYIRHCLESKEWWAKAITLHQNTDCIQFHIHNLLCCIPVVIEAIEIAGEIAGLDHDDMLRKRMMFSKKYQKECKDPKIFQWRFGKEYLVTQEICNRLETAWREDRWMLLNKIREKSISNSSTKHVLRFTDLLLRKLNVLEDDANWKLLPTSILVGSKDYQVRRRLGSGSQYKEIIWFGESFVLRHLFTNVEPFIPQISLLHSLHHPNVLPLLCSFVDDEKKELFLVMETMSRNLDSYIKEISGTRKRIPFALPVAVDLMLQIARGMEYLHSKKIYHGDLNPSNVFVKARGGSSEGYLHAKISGFGISECISSSQKSSSKENGTLPFIWHAPEILAEQEEGENANKLGFAEKSDVYSFGMICFELLTGKVPFEDLHLQGDKMSRNIRAGERPLFPFHTPKYLINLTKRCWHTDPTQRPSFSSTCRILRYVKRFLVMNPDYSNQADPPVPPVDYLDIESRLLRSFPSWESPEPPAVHEIPFQMFVYRVAEHEKTSINMKENSESGSEGTSVCGDENMANGDDSFPCERKLSLSPNNSTKNLTLLKKLPDVKTLKQPGTPKGRSPRPPHVANRSLRMNSESQLLTMSPKMRRSTSGHSSDSEVA